MKYIIERRNPTTGATEQTPFSYTCQRDKNGNLIEFKDENDMAVMWAKYYESLVNDGFEYGVKLAE